MITFCHGHFGVRRRDAEAEIAGESEYKQQVCPTWLSRRGEGSDEVTYCLKLLIRNFYGCYLNKYEDSVCVTIINMWCISARDALTILLLDSFVLWWHTCVAYPLLSDKAMLHGSLESFNGRSTHTSQDLLREACEAAVVEVSRNLKFEDEI